MKNFIAELLVKLAEKEDEANALRIQVDALEVVVTTLLLHMKQPRSFLTVSMFSFFKYLYMEKLT